MLLDLSFSYIFSYIFRNIYEGLDGGGGQRSH